MKRYGARNWTTIVLTDEGDYLSGMSALNLVDPRSGEVADWHQGGWRGEDAEKGTACHAASMRIDEGRVAWKERGLHDGRPALREIGHPGAQAAEPIPHRVTRPSHHGPRARLPAQRYRADGGSRGGPSQPVDRNAEVLADGPGTGQPNWAAATGRGTHGVARMAPHPAPLQAVGHEPRGMVAPRIPAVGVETRRAPQRQMFRQSRVRRAEGIEPESAAKRSRRPSDPQSGCEAQAARRRPRHNRASVRAEMRRARCAKEPGSRADCSRWARMSAPNASCGGGAQAELQGMRQEQQPPPDRPRAPSDQGRRQSDGPPDGPRADRPRMAAERRPPDLPRVLGWLMMCWTVAAVVAFADSRSTGGQSSAHGSGRKSSRRSAPTALPSW